MNPPNLLIQMSGHPGSGKSTVANLLAASLNATVINHDLIKSFFLEKEMTFAQASKLTYDLDWVLARDAIGQGRNVVVDSPCNWDEMWENGTTLAKESAYEYLYIECCVDDEKLLNLRMAQRVPMRCQRTSVDRPPMDVMTTFVNESSDTLIGKWLKNPCRPKERVILVDSTQRPEECVRYILEQIASLKLGEARATDNDDVE